MIVNLDLDALLALAFEVPNDLSAVPLPLDLKKVELLISIIIIHLDVVQGSLFLCGLQIRVEVYTNTFVLL